MQRATKSPRSPRVSRATVPRATGRRAKDKDKDDDPKEVDKAKKPRRLRRVGSIDDHATGTASVPTAPVVSGADVEATSDIPAPPSSSIPAVPESESAPPPDRGQGRGLEYRSLSPLSDLEDSEDEDDIEKEKRAAEAEAEARDEVRGFEEASDMEMSQMSEDELPLSVLTATAAPSISTSDVFMDSPGLTAAAPDLTTKVLDTTTDTPDLIMSTLSPTESFPSRLSTPPHAAPAELTPTPTPRISPRRIDPLQPFLSSLESKLPSDEQLPNADSFSFLAESNDGEQDKEYDGPLFSEEEPEKGDKGMMSEVSFESSRPTIHEEDDDDDDDTPLWAARARQIIGQKPSDSQVVGTAQVRVPPPTLAGPFTAKESTVQDKAVPGPSSIPSRSSVDKEKQVTGDDNATVREPPRKKRKLNSRDAAPKLQEQPDIRERKRKEVSNTASPGNCPKKYQNMTILMPPRSPGTSKSEASRSASSGSSSLKLKLRLQEPFPSTPSARSVIVTSS